jgi:hypothetical protein
LIGSTNIRALIEKHLPAEYRPKFTWRQLAGMLRRAAQGKEDAAEVSTALSDGAQARRCGVPLGRRRV